ncbi:MAG TPA: RNase adapter RapZ [Burkholderiales bacterium]|nr:RNase adapter RapZ [Burkholderiales bacterium]
MQLILITGLSGSGKSVALNVLEDSGHNYVDNLPLKLLQQTVDLLAASRQERVALSIDMRSAEELADLPGLLAGFRKRGHDVRVLFLEAKTDTLIKRFSETRRRHPLADDKLTLTECIERERELLADIADLAHRVDTSDLGPNTLRGWVKDFVGLPHAGLTLLFESFGFKHGVPLNADLVFDVRCLPNPNYDPRLRPLTGRDPAVVDFLGSDPATRKMLEDIHRFVADWLPAFERDNRSYLTVAIGCTGGQHRSVYLAEALAGLLRGRAQALVRHRELSA